MTRTVKKEVKDTDILQSIIHWNSNSTVCALDSFLSFPLSLSLLLLPSLLLFERNVKKPKWGRGWKYVRDR